MLHIPTDHKEEHHLLTILRIVFISRAVEVTPWTENAPTYTCIYKTYFGELSDSCGIAHVRIAADGASSTCAFYNANMSVDARAISQIVSDHLGIR